MTRHEVHSISTHTANTGQ